MSLNLNCDFSIYILMGKWFAFIDFQQIYFLNHPRATYMASRETGGIDQQGYGMGMPYPEDI